MAEFGPSGNPRAVVDDLTHELLYKAGSYGLEHLGLASGAPHWFCVCRRWRFAARAMPRRRTGTNKTEAFSAWRAHVRYERQNNSSGG
jgi:hypothetical protein